MSFSFGEGRVRLREIAARFATGAASSGAVRAADEQAVRHDPALWREMVDFGWTALAVPEKFGAVVATRQSVRG